MNATFYFFIFNVFVVGGVFVEFLYTNPRFFLTGRLRRKTSFSLSRYALLLAFPFLGLVVLWSLIGNSVPLVFTVAAVFGALLEWCVGSSYHAIVGRRLWTYHRGSIGGYTSIFSLPIWGLGGIYFWLLFQLLPI